MCHLPGDPLFVHVVDVREETFPLAFRKAAA